MISKMAMIKVTISSLWVYILEPAPSSSLKFLMTISKVGKGDGTLADVNWAVGRSRSRWREIESSRFDAISLFQFWIFGHAEVKMDIGNEEVVLLQFGKVGNEKVLN